VTNEQFPVVLDRPVQDFPVLTAMKRTVEQRPNDYEGWLSELIETATHAETARIDARQVFGRHVRRGSIWNGEGSDLWVEGCIPVCSDDEGDVFWQAGWLLTVGRDGIEDCLSAVDTVLRGPSGTVIPMPTRILFDWRPFAEKTSIADPDPDPDDITDISTADLARAGLGLQTTRGASLDALVRMASGLAFHDAHSVHVAEDIPGGEVWRRSAEQLVAFVTSLGGADCLRKMLAAVVVSRQVPEDLDAESAELLDGLDERIMLGGRGMLAALDVLQFARRKSWGVSKP
jgi:hypothetical protein